MATAKTYIYRNLNRGGFSSKYKGRVVSRFGSQRSYDNVAIAMVDGFQVSEVVRQKIVATGKKQVHAYITTSMILQSNQSINLDGAPQVKYNPRTDTFFYVTDGTPIDDIKMVVFNKDTVYGFSQEELKKWPELCEYVKFILDNIRPQIV